MSGAGRSNSRGLLRRLDRLALIRFGILVALIAAGTVAVVVVGVPDADTLRANFAENGLLGVLAFIGLYALLSLTPIPASALTIAAGISFGLARGILVVDIAATLGAVVAFHLGRMLGRDAVRGMASGRLDTLDELLGRRGLLSVLVVRMVPIFPFAVVNYASGLTAVRARDYAVGTAIGILPVTSAYAAVGAFGSKPGSLPFVFAVASLVMITVAGATVTRRRSGGTSGVAAPESVPEDAR